MGNVIALEHPELCCTRLDLDPSPEANVLDPLFNALWHQTLDDRAAWRQGVCYLPRLIRCASPIEKQDDLPASTAEPSPLIEAEAIIRDEGTYLISGGLGALGLVVAEWMVKEGARHLVLVGRNPAKPEAEQLIEGWEKRGAEIHVMQGNLAWEEDVKGILDTIQSALPPLKGIIHAAGVLDDGMIPQQTWQRFENVLQPKRNGAWNLHLLTEKLPLDFFILFSSAAAVMGNLGQSNYAAANAFLDALAHYRRAQGLPAISINWGPWATVGMASRETSQENRLANRGVQGIHPEDGLTLLKRILRENQPQRCVIDINWSQYVHHLLPEQKSGFYSALIADLPSTGTGGGAETSLIIKELSDATIEERPQLLLSFMQDLAGSVIGESQTLPEDAPLMEQGFDSMMAVDLKNRLNKALHSNLPASLLFEYPTLTKITDFLLDEILSFEDADLIAPSAQEEKEDTTVEALLEEIDDLLQAKNE